MISSITQWILETLRTHGAVSVFIGVIIESVIVPIPSPLIIMGAGAILIDPTLSISNSLPLILLLIVLPGSVASTIGAYIGYGIGYWGGKVFVDKFERFLGFGWSNVITMEKHFIEGKIGKLIFSLRALPIVPLSLISVAAGAIRVPIWPFTLWTFIGSIPRCLFLGYLGWLMHDTYVSIAGNLNLIEGIVSGIIVLSGIGLVLWLRMRLHRIK
mgnify:FL=1